MPWKIWVPSFTKNSNKYCSVWNIFLLSDELCIFLPYWSVCLDCGGESRSQRRSWWNCPARLEGQTHCMPKCIHSNKEISSIFHWFAWFIYVHKYMRRNWMAWQLLNNLWGNDIDWILKMHLWPSKYIFYLVQVLVLWILYE